MRSESERERVGFSLEVGFLGFSGGVIDVVFFCWEAQEG